MTVAVAVMHYLKQPVGAAFTPISSIPAARGSYGAATGALALARVCSARATTMAATTMATVSVLPCPRFPRVSSSSHYLILSASPSPGDAD